MGTVFSNVKMMILDTFFFEENTIFHVENHLKYYGFKLNRDEIKDYISELFEEGYIKIHGDPSDTIEGFKNSDDNFIEDYWFVLTEKGRKDLNNYKDNTQN